LPTIPEPTLQERVYAQHVHHEYLAATEQLAIRCQNDWVFMVAPILLNRFPPLEISLPLRVLFKPEIKLLEPSSPALFLPFQLEKVIISEQVSTIHLTSLKNTVASLGMDNLQLGTPSEGRAHLSR
jgi:hypothetical protein